jgi:hypothetical protein
MGFGQIYNTTWWGNALDTARTAGTEPDFFGSQMKLLTSNQPELISNGTFESDTAWTKGSGWTISGGKANASATTGQLYQGTTTTINTQYKIEYTISNYVSGSYNFLLRGTSTATFSGNGTFTVYITSGSGGNSNFIIDGVSSFTGSIDNVSVKEVRLDLDQIEAKKCLADWIHVTALQDLNN